MKDTNYNHGCRVISLSHNHGLVADIKDKWNELQERVESVDLEKGKLVTLHICNMPGVFLL